MGWRQKLNLKGLLNILEVKKILDSFLKVITKSQNNKITPTSHQGNLD